MLVKAHQLEVENLLNWNSSLQICYH